ncbi:hypothetical protein IVB69_08340 [Flavobacterium sp. J49]|uniref:hypothetical protein n=1 Tax=Flavobacterium sp. J49 TaxID=2718534 RepID=UPI0015941B3F|nr:hypothetical protein [Flavobacterium sp. J49]MBF6641487.1 hypothetical protein [Flavobacterium sp. J49]NIC02734.1 hypothetical protein [Flavobacterium sp. J49]
MKLSTEQIEKIDRILEKLGLDFLDFKLEIKDHIACQTEELREEKNISFEEALPLVLKEWEPNLLLKSSIWVSNKRSFSVFVLNGIRKRYYIYNSIAIPIILLFFLLHFIYRKEIDTDFLSGVMLGFISIILPILLGFRYLIYKKNKETSYSYEFNRICKMVSLFWMIDVVFYFLIGIAPIIIWNAMIVAYSPIAFYSYYKHNQFCKHLDEVIA